VSRRIAHSELSNVRLHSDSLVTLELLSQTDHSTIHTCRVSSSSDQVFVVKRTSAELCDFEALKHLVSQSSKRPASLSAIPYAVWREGRHVFELQEFVPGPSLGRIVMRNRTPVAHGALLRTLLVDLANELNWLRGIDVVHRDITPFNIIVSANGLRLIDWSFSCGTSKPQSPVQTLGFTASEQLRGQATNDSDWFGFASTLAFLAIGNGQVYTDPAREIDFQSLSMNHGNGLRLCYRLRNAKDNDRVNEAGLIRELLINRASISNIYYEPVSSPGPVFERDVKEFRVLEIESGSLVIGNRRWFLLPQDLPHLSSELRRIYHRGDLSGSDEVDLRSVLTPIHPQLAAVL
jgi:serine/threonine protein kinase